MARREYIGGGRQGFQINPIDFWRGGDGSDKGDDAMAMALMGYGKGGGPQGRALDERTQAALELFQQGQLANMEAQRRIQEAGQKSEAGARTAEANRWIQEGKLAAEKETQRQKEAAEGLKATKAVTDQDRAMRLIDSLVKEQKIAVGDPEYIRLMEKATPGYAEESKQIEQAARERKITEGLTKYQQADPKAKAQYAKDPATMGAGITPEVYGEILKRANVNVAQPGAPAAASSGGRGGLGEVIPDVLWNLPGGVENLFRMGANLGSSAWYGKDAPQYELMPWTHAADAWTQGGPKVAPAVAGPVPRPQFGNYGVQAEPTETPPEWQYGVGPQRPPASLNDLLAKALQGQ